MGVDAMMFVRLKGEGRHKTPEQVHDLSVAMAVTLGSGNFFIRRQGDHFGEPRHALSIVPPISEESEDWEKEEFELGQVVWFQDGDPILAGKDEQFIQVHLMGRYYGPDYERGDWPVIRSVAEWLEMFTEGEVWYGGDSGGYCAERFDVEARDRFNRHFLTRSIRDDDYYAPKNRRMFDHIFGESPTCVCSFCRIEMLDSGGGGGGARRPGGYTFFECQGCGHRVIKTHDGRHLKPAGPGIRWTGRDGFVSLKSCEP